MNRSGDLVRVVCLDGHYYEDCGDGDVEEIREVPPEALERWELNLPAFLNALSEVNGLRGEVRELGPDTWRLGVRRATGQRTDEVVFVGAGTHDALDLHLQDVQRQVGGAPLCALLAEPHALSGAAVGTLSSRGIRLVALTEMLGSDLHVDFGEPGQPGCATTARLVINPATREATFDGVAVKLTPLPFELLVLLAQTGPQRYLHATDLPDGSELARAANAPMALSDCVRRIRNAFRNAFEAAGSDSAAANGLIENRPRVGYRLTVPKDDVTIL
jgi:DNA-binding winged helix-turn-helix (wHTH) protein